MESIELKLALNRLESLKLKEKLLLVKEVGDLATWERLTKKDLEIVLKRPLRAPINFSFFAQQSRRDMVFLRRTGYFLLQWRDVGYPPALAEIPNPPFLLWGRGQIPQLTRPWVSVVGTRTPSEEARLAAFELARDLSQAGMTVVSGLARGIDSSAHRGSMEGGMPTVAVLGQGIDWIFPSSSRSVARRLIVRGGCLLSEYGPGDQALAYRFVARNRIISGLSQTVVVIQAPIRSGALITASLASAQGRDVLVHNKGLSGIRGAGGRLLAEQGVVVISSVSDIKHFWNSNATSSCCHQKGFLWKET